MKKCTWLVALTALVLCLGAIETACAELLPPYGEGQIGFQAEILSSELTLHEKPSASSKAIKTLQYGDFLIVVEQADGWAYCTLGDSEEALMGWAEADYLAIDPARYRTEENTPVYAWSDTDAPKVALLEKDTLLPVLKAEGDWIAVSLRGAAGWIHYANKPERQNGERFETTVMLEGMEETIRCEHIVNTGLGIEMDYDYESFLRRGEADGECFISLYDDPQQPLNFLEVTFIAQNADAVAAAISEALSGTYEITQEPYTLKRAGDCIALEASRMKDADLMPEQLQKTYIIPNANGSVVATMHCTIESAEGFGRRISNMLDTLALKGGQAR